MNIIAAADENWGIGINGGLLFHIGADMARFKRLTMGHDIIMGRKTLESLPDSRPLKGRRNIVLSKSARFGGCVCVRSLDEAVKAASPDAFVIGGGSVYRSLLSLCDTAYITKIYAHRECDTYFPSLDDLPDWRLAESGALLEENGIPFRFLVYRRG